MTKEISPRSPNDIDRQVGARLRLARQLRNISQETLGEEIGVTFQQIQKYERGANRISASRLYTLANFLGLPLSYFFNEDEKDILVSASEEFNKLNGKDAMAVLEVLNNSSPSVRSSLVGMIKSIGADQKEADFSE